MWTLWKETGLEPKVVDLSSDCLARLYARLNKQTLKANSGEHPKDLAIVDINSDGVEFLLLEHGVFFVYSDFETELTEISQYEEIATSQDLGQAEHTDLAKQAQLQLPETFSPVLRTLAEFLSFFAMRHFGKNVDEIYLTGELAPLPYLAELFERELGISTRAGFLNDWKPSYGRKVGIPENDGIKYGSLYGLAMRED
jgi:type IV pilus assembly protein PilM